MKPSFLDEMSWAMAEVYGAVTDRILVNLAHYFPYIKDSDEVQGSFAYQARMLAQMGQVNRETVDIITKSLGGADVALRQALETAIIEALKPEEPKLQKAAKQGLLNGGGFIPPEVSPGQMQAFKSYYKQSADKLNLVNTVMLESTQAAYTATVSDVANKIARTQSILNIGTGEVVSGVSAYNQAIRSSVQKMVQNGLTGFVDHGGHHWSPEAYVAMDIRTTMFNTSRAAIWERADDYGCDLYQVSSHNGARPLCYPWQGKVISRNDLVREVEDLDGTTVHVYAQSETSYGEAAGLFGVNCKHYPMTFIPGFSTLKGEPQDPEENEKTYEESQQQRALERKLREERRDLAVMKAQGASPEEIKAQRERVKKASQDIDDFCDETGRARRKNREGTPINATFPPKGSYDPKEFPHDERDRINDWFKNGGMDDNPPPRPTNIHLGPDNIPPQGQAQIPIQTAEETKTSFTPAKTMQEAEKYAERFGKQVNYQGISLENCNKINEELNELYSRYPKTKQYDRIVQNARQKSIARSCWNELEINGKKIGAKDKGFFELNQQMDRITLETIRKRYDGKTIPKDMQKQIELLENKLKFKRFSVAGKYDVRGVIAHEFGHTVADQYIGQINDTKANPNAHDLSCFNLRNLISETRNRAFKTGDIYSLSKYGSSDDYEFFAEVFCAHEMGEPIPDYFEDMLSEVLKNAPV